MKPPRGAIRALLDGRHADPFSLLGPHPGPKGLFARAWAPGAHALDAYALDGAALGPLELVADEGLFEGYLSGETQPLRYHARGEAGSEWWFTDPYSFAPVLGSIDDLLLAEGTHRRLYEKMGAHAVQHQGVDGFHFAVWAPNARQVSLVGDFNDWEPRRHPMRLRGDSGVWEIFLPDIAPGRHYKFAITGPDGKRQPLKADPFAQRTELRPGTASITTASLSHNWGDHTHREHWRSVDPRRQAMAIYEVHAGSWMRNEHDWFLDWDALADRLIPYVVDLGFTHIELLPITEHPYDPSWGYQTTGLFAPSARFGDPAGFARFVDGAHRAGIGIILDWVPAHFPTDAHGLVRFDGTALYEHEDPRQGMHPDWNTAIYNFGRREVRAFLINSALYWTDRFHVDALRVDAVASMLYRDYSREPGEWIPNEQGGRENWEAADFLREANIAVYGEQSGALTIAEESTTWPGVTAPAYEGGLGFGFKWNMGFMNDTLRYLARDPVHRRYHHNDITFGLTYAFSENYVLPLSHDEVVHGKRSLLEKMAGDDWQKFAQLRAYYAFMWGYPGKKLLFMGQEFAQRREWSENRALDWHLRDLPMHEGVRRTISDLNRLYRDEAALHERDCEAEGFRWLIVDDAERSVFAWLRQAPGAPSIAIISNFTPTPHDHYPLPLPHDGHWAEVFNSDAEIYGGSGMGNLGGINARRGTADIVLPPLATIIVKHEPGGEASNG